jgi:anti-sigma B factor antagonist
MPVLSTVLKVRGCDGHLVVTLHGELDLVDAAAVATALTAAADREPRVVVDLASLEFVDVSGVAALARARKHARRAGGNLLLAAPRPQMMRLLSTPALAYRFSVYASAEEAVSGFRGPMGVAALRPLPQWPGVASGQTPCRSPRSTLQALR